MIDISVKDLVKSFDADTNLLDGVSFDVGRIFCSSLDTITFRLFRDVLTNNTSYATEYAKKKIQLNVYLKKFVEQFDKIA